MSKRISLAGEEEKSGKLLKNYKTMGPSKSNNIPEEQHFSMPLPNFI